jgi:hypothetical protein
VSGQLPVDDWDVETDRKQKRHVGPRAQDFHAAFPLNGDVDEPIAPQQGPLAQTMARSY